MKPVSEKPVSSELYTDIEYEKYYTCAIELGDDFLELFVPEDPKHSPSEVSYSCTEYCTDSEVKESDISTDISISSDRKYYNDNHAKNLESSKELRVDMFICNFFLFLEMLFESMHGILVIFFKQL